MLPLAKVRPGDRVAVLSPSFAAPAVGPAVHELALRRIRDELGLVPVEYPTTRQLGAAAADRAADLQAAFADPAIRAVFATIGGDDSITVVPHLDPAVFRADPKPYFGYSDNANVLNWLWFHDIPSYHGGSTQVHLGRAVALHPISVGSLRSALFDSGDVEITAAAEFSEDEIDWNDPGRLTWIAPTSASDGWFWHRPDRVVTGPTWGGNLEILNWILAVSRFVRPVDDYAGCVLLLETSEEMPPAEEVFRVLRNLGERGLLAQFPALLMARPKASFLLDVRTAEQRVEYRAGQRDAVLRAFAAYNPDAMIVFDVDFGHTDPQWVLPYGGQMTIDGPNRRIIAHY